MAAPLEAILKANTDVRLVVYQNGAFGELSEDAASLSGRLTQQHKDGYSFYNAALSQASLSPQGLAQLARQYGLSSKEIATAMQPDERAKAVEPGRAVTQALAINGTPSFIVGDQMIFGAQGKDLSDAIAVTRKSLN